MRAPSLRLSELLRASASKSAPVELLLDSWSQVEDAVLADTGHAREDLAAASSALPPIAGAISDRRALATAVMTVAGQVCFADAAFAPARAYVDASRRLMGEEVAMVVPTERKGFMNRLLGRRAA